MSGEKNRSLSMYQDDTALLRNLLKCIKVLLGKSMEYILQQIKNTLKTCLKIMLSSHNQSTKL